MTHKTEDIEEAVMFALERGPKSLGEMAEHWLVGIDDQRGIGGAVGWLVQDGRVRYAGCDVSHNHGGGCVIEAVAR